MLVFRTCCPCRVWIREKTCLASSSICPAAHDLRSPRRSSAACKSATSDRDADTKPSAAAVSTPAGDGTQQPSASKSNGAVSEAACSPNDAQFIKSGYGYTLSSMYIPKPDMPTFVQLDHESKRKEREIKEIAEAARKIGLSEQAVRENIAALEKLLPDLKPSMNKMRASEWAKMVSDVNNVAMTMIVLKTAYPAANISRIIGRSPRILLQSLEQVQGNAAKVKQILAKVDGEGEIEGIIEAVPYLLDPRELQQSLSNLKGWFPNQDPIEVLRKNPSLLLNIGESDIAADPLYGEDVGNLH